MIRFNCNSTTSSLNTRDDSEFLKNINNIPDYWTWKGRFSKELLIKTRAYREQNNNK